MADKNKAPKELMDIAAQQGTHAAKNVAAAASEAISEVIPKKETEAIALLVRVSNKTLLVAAVSATAVATAAAVTRFQKERALKKVEAEKNGSGIQYHRMDGEPVVAKPVVKPVE